MYLKSLDLIGFKSFAQRTVLEFLPHGISAVVGPNGCGKSNVLDAIGWVLGETSARALRGEEMADVIFKGTEKKGEQKGRAALGMAEVTLTFGGCHGVWEGWERDELSVTRRIYRDGKSVYQINGKTCRLRDLSALFLDTGIACSSYSMIGQGKMEALIDVKGDRGREVFEEVAGIRQFKLQKKESLRRLQEVASHCKQISLLLEEKGKNLDFLTAQSQRALQAKQLQEGLDCLEMHWNFEKKRQIESRLENASHRLHRAETMRQDAKKNTEEARLFFEEKESVENALAQREYTVHEAFKECENQLEHCENSIAFHREKMDAWNGFEQNTDESLKELRQEESSIVSEKRQLEQKSSSFDYQLSCLGKQVRFFQERAQLYTEQKRELASKEATFFSKKKSLGIALSRLEGRMEAFKVSREETLEELEGALEEKKQKIALLEQQKSKKTLLLQKKEAHQAQLIEKKKQIHQVLSSLLKTLNAQQEKKNKLHKELMTINLCIEQLEGFLSLREQISWAKVAEKRSLLFEKITVQPGYEKAIEAFLQEALNAVLVEDMQEALLLLDEKNAQEGLIALSKKMGEEQQTSLPVKGVLPLVECLEVEEGLKERLGQVCAGVGVVENWHHVEQVFLQNRHLEQLIDREGVICQRNGLLYFLPQKVSFLEKKAELALLKSQYEDCNGAFQRACKEEKKRQEELSEQQAFDKELLASLQGLEKDCQETIFLLRDIHQSILLEQKGVQGLKKHIDHVQNEREKAHKNYLACQSEYQEKTHFLETLEQGDNLLASEKKRLLLKGEASQRALAKKARQKDRIAQQKAGVERDLTLYVKRVSSLKEKRIRLESSLRAMQAKRKHSAQCIEQQTLEKKQCTTKKRQLEQAYGLVKKQRIEALSHKKKAMEVFKKRQKVEKESEAFLAKALLAKEKEQLAFEHFCRTLEMSSRHHLEGFSPNWKEVQDVLERGFSPEDQEDFSFLEQEIARRRKAVELLGPIDYQSIEQERKVRNDYEELLGQRDDLLESQKRMDGLIAQLDRESIRLFNESFYKIANYFESTFITLFGKGSAARLALADPKNPLESPILIEAKPAGKRLKNISLLSGGERSMTALSLLFSIYAIKPSPFCVLDELDAPLDEANVERFLTLLEDFSQQSQFILITHNRRTMESASRIYGITMEQRGVSKSVVLCLEEKLSEDIE